MPKDNKPKSKKTNLKPVIEEVVEPQKTPESPKPVEIEELESSPETPIVEKKQKKKTNFKLMFLITIITAAFTGLLAGGFYVYFTGIGVLTNSQEHEDSAQPTPVSIPTPAPKSSPDINDENQPKEEEKVDVSLYKIQVLNGSGKIGEASKAEKILLADGYKVSSVGNASSYSHKQTEIQHKKDVPNIVIEGLSDLLSKAYSVSEEKLDPLPDKSNYDIVITVGSQ